MTAAVSLATVAADLAIARSDGQKYFSAALTVSIALVVLAYLMVLAPVLGAVLCGAGYWAWRTRYR